ncbi:Cyclohexadienyl dehydrogenase [hydrothermal vent metagenome]|uniref:Cyclohexadienyl dehydrogenase n=1 Tax=hydrothermal vent metagenome TaxID=652676 RepID=A0A3B0XAW4_9ZZZZ
MIKHLCVIGTGLIGGSLALALKKSGHVAQITGLGREAEQSLKNLQKAKELGVIDHYETSYAKAITPADMVFIAVPIGAMADVFYQIAPHLRPHAIVTDGASSKHTVIDAAIKKLGKKVSQFVPGHPIAGTEKSGVEAAFPTLYNGRRVVLTPLEENTQASIASVRDMWLAAGAKVDEMGARHHDLVLAATSHLPHVLAFALVDSLNKMDDADEVFKYAAGGFRDFTRIASSDAVMWRDICLNNSEAILAMMHRYQDELDILKQAILASDGDQLMEIFSDAKRARDSFCM